MDNVRFRGKPIESLTREELIEALRQALARIRELEAAPPIDEEPRRAGDERHD